MPKLTGPFMALAASGKLGPALQLAITRHGTHLTLDHRPTLTRTRKQISIRTFTQALTQTWHFWKNSVRDIWATHPRAATTSPYHAFLWHNHQLLKLNRYPVLLYDRAPVGSPPTIVGWGAEGRAQALSFIITSYTGAFMWIMAITHTPLLSAGITPNKTNCWAWLPYPPNKWKEVLHLAPGTYTAWFLGVDAYGRPSNAKSPGGLVVTP